MKEYTSTFNNRLYKFTIIKNEMILLSCDNRIEGNNVWKFDENNVFHIRFLFKQNFDFSLLTDSKYVWTNIPYFSNDTLDYIYNIIKSSDYNLLELPDWFINLIVLSKLKE